MSTPFPLEAQSQLDRATDYYDPEKAGPRWYAGMGFNEDTAYTGPFFRALEGAGEGAAKGEALLAGNWHGFLSGVAGVAEAVHAPAAGAIRAVERTAADVKADADARVKALTPDPATTGSAVQTIHGLVSGAYRVGVGALAGGPVVGATFLGTTEGKSRYDQLREQGVDELTARRAALLEGTAAGAGAFLPAGYGTTLLTRLATGAAGNMGFGLVNRYADHAILDSAGYHEMADQQRALDATQMLTDGLLGAAFGGISHLHARVGEAARDAPGVEDAALTANLALRDRALAPGVPVDPAAANAHDAALRQATTDLLQGRPVDVSHTGVDRADFATRPMPDTAEPQAALLRALGETHVLDEERNLAALEEALGARLRGEKPAAPAVVAAAHEVAGEIPRAKDLTPEQRAIEDRFAQQISSDVAGAKTAYARLPDSDGGRILNTDTARELSADYVADRTQSKPVHEPASWLVKQLYADALAQPADANHDNRVLMMAGGTGAGKSTAVKSALGEDERRAQIIYDTNMNGLASAERKIEQAKGAGKAVDIVYVHRDPVESLTAGALKRAMGQEAKFGSGRTVPIDEHVATHVGANATIRELARRYANDPQVRILILDNSRGRGNVRVMPVEELPRLDYNLTREQVHEALEREYAAGRISAAVYRGFSGREPGSGPSPVPAAPAAAAAAHPGPTGGPPGAEPGRQPEPQRAGGRSDQLTHEVMTATGRRVTVQPKLAELSDLVTSDQAAYPKELQPRQRGARAALTEQVRSIAVNLNPELLGNAPEADRGAPIVGPENVVESGNGRAFALREVYANHPENAEAYRAFLERQGFDTKGLKQPVLVRERVTQMTDEERRAFTVEANQTSVAALSPVERAQADARLLEPAVLAQLRNGEIAQVQNAPFVRAFLSRLPEAERNALVNPDGSVSQEGVRRLQAAILAKAYGGAAESNAVLGRMLESTDNEMRATMGALLDAAPAGAKLREAIEEGKIGPEYDLSRALTQAVEATARVRESGQAFGEFLKQADFLTRRLPVVETLMRALYDKKGERMAPRAAVAERLMNYFDRALKQRLDQGTLFGDTPLPPERLLEVSGAKEAAEPMRPGADLFGLRTPQDKPVSPALRVAGDVLARSPNLELPDEAGETTRARAELMSTTDARQMTEERAPGALENVATCGAQRPEAA